MARCAACSGFSLIELMVATGIAAILASIGWSSYSDVVKRVRRSDARVALLRIQHAQEMFYARHNRYADSLDPSQGLAAPAHSDSGDYELVVIAGADNQTYVATAVARAMGRQHDDLNCRSMSVDAAGTRSSTNSAGQAAAESGGCW